MLDFFEIAKEIVIAHHNSKEEIRYLEPSEKRSSGYYVFKNGVISSPGFGDIESARHFYPNAVEVMP